MFRIRKRQMDALSTHTALDFERRMATHLARFFGPACATLGPDGVTQLIRDGIQRAARHGIRAEQGVAIYTDAMVRFGADFDVDPTLPWAADILADPALDNEHARAQRLLDATCEHAAEARGPAAAGKRAS